ncbi:MAG TPA: phosphoribosyltransferase family protein [Chitinophagaceae bacterium]|nr:phosphoribosyltransferase family protein [Chitinophagaceae bacterium]
MQELKAEIQIQDKKFNLFISGSRIRDKVKNIAAIINADLKDEQPLFIAVLNGSFIYAADLFRELTIPAEICFIKLASYTGTASTGPLITAIGLNVELKDRTVVILEDIVDTGRTMHDFLPQILDKKPRKVLVTALLTKPDAIRYPISIDYPGFPVPDKFMVGYGLDYNGLGRNLQDIYCLSE